MIPLLSLLQDAQAFLSLSGVQNPRREAEDLLAFALGCSRLDLLLWRDEELNPKQIAHFLQLVRDRGQRIPFAYLTKQVDFFGLQFEIDSNVLIPRIETEELVEAIVRSNPQGRWLDLCCGSGAIGLSLKHECPHLDVTLADISPAALEVAQRNAQRQHLKVHFVQSDLMKDVHGLFDGIVCNPPYLSAREWFLVEEEVRQEPKLALVGGVTGYEYYEQLASTVKVSHVWLEIGANMGSRVLQLFLDQGYQGKIFLDAFGRERYLYLQRS